jgi:hypothetical protein
MKVFDSSNCGRAASDERKQIEPAKLSRWRRFLRAMGFDRIFAEVDRIVELTKKAREAADRESA